MKKILFAASAILPFLVSDGASALDGYGYPGTYRYSGPGLVRPCFPGPGCRADGYPDARYYGGYGYSSQPYWSGYAWPYGYRSSRLSGECFPGPGCRADGHPDARYYGGYGFYGPRLGYGRYRYY